MVYFFQLHTDEWTQWKDTLLLFLSLTRWHNYEHHKIITDLHRLSFLVILLSRTIGESWFNGCLKCHRIPHPPLKFESLSSNVHTQHILRCFSFLRDIITAHNSLALFFTLNSNTQPNGRRHNFIMYLQDTYHSQIFRRFAVTTFNQVQSLPHHNFCEMAMQFSIEINDEIKTQLLLDFVFCQIKEKKKKRKSILWTFFLSSTCLCLCNCTSLFNK